LNKTPQVFGIAARYTLCSEGDRVKKNRPQVVTVRSIEKKMPHSREETKSGSVIDFQDLLSKENASDMPSELEVVAERARKCQRIKAQVEAGTYKVENRKIARAILGLKV